MIYDDKVLLSDGRYFFTEGDYGRSIPFQLYDQDDAKFIATGYTAYVKLYPEGSEDEAIDEISPTWTAQATGAGTFAFTSSNTPMAGRYILKVQLEKSGELRSFVCIHPIAVQVAATGPRSP